MVTMILIIKVLLSPVSAFHSSSMLESQQGPVVLLQLGLIKIVVTEEAASGRQKASKHLGNTYYSQVEPTAFSVFMQLTCRPSGTYHCR